MSTAYFPLTANPVGYHHLLLAETVMRQFPETELVVFILSNGKHPDPLKRQQIPDQFERFHILQQALLDWTIPEKSIPAQIVQMLGDSLELSPEKCAISRRELAINHAVRLSDHINSISKAGKMQMIIGADLIERMSNFSIFTDEDLLILSSKCLLLASPRDNISVQPELKRLKKNRGFTLNVIEIETEQLPAELRPFLKLSSTLIRRASQSKQKLTVFLPAGSEKWINNVPLYQTLKQPLLLNEWQKQCYVLNLELDQLADKFKLLLDQLAESKQKHKFAVVESSTGGKISAHIVACSGASKHFIEGLIVYDREAQERFLARNLKNESSATELRAKELAETMLKKSQAHWAIAETGMIGPPSFERYSHKNGECHLALAFHDEILYKYLQFNPFLTRKEHQLLFSIETIKWVTMILKQKFQ